MKKKMIAVCVLAAATAVISAAACLLGMNPPVVNVAGAFAVSAAAFLMARFFRIPEGLFYTGLLFLFFASPVGSVLDLYRLWGPYDKIVHFASGLLLAAAGFAVISHLLSGIFKETCVKPDEVSSEKEGRCRIYVNAVTLLTAFLFAAAGAGLWEIFEFTADRIVGGGMQRGMVDTLTDMISGTLGGLTYCAAIPLKKKKLSTKSQQSKDRQDKRRKGIGA